jgi:hypothetical protein
LAEGTKAVAVPTAGLEAGGFGVHAVRVVGTGAEHAACGDAGEGFVVRHFPLHVDRVGQAVAEQTCPQHHAVRAWRTGGHAEREAVDLLRKGVAMQRCHADAGGTALQQRTAAQGFHHHHRAGCHTTVVPQRAC